MRNDKNRRVGGILLLLAAVLFLGWTAPVSAAEPVLDPSQTGSIKVQMRDQEGNYVGGGSLISWQVAEILVDEVGQPYYSYTEMFADLDASYLEDPGDSELGGIFYKEIVRAVSDMKSVEELTEAGGKAVYIDEKGVGTLKDLPLGIYLLFQFDTAEGYTAISPFVVTVPLKQGDAYEYDVVAWPKFETAKEVETSPAETSPAETSSEPSSENEGNGKQPTDDDNDQEPTTAPPESGTDHVREIDVEEDDYEEDEEDETETEPETKKRVPGGSSSGGSSGGSSSGSSSSSSSRLPQTGLFLWPLLFAALLGLALTGSGYRLAFGKKASERRHA